MHNRKEEVQKMKRSTLRKLAALAVGTAMVAAASTAMAHLSDVQLLDKEGYPLVEGSTTPYSPKMTCGKCHDYEKITSGFHFMQGFDELIDDETRLAGEKPFIKSLGMYGKW
ncbi:MAG: hypothetical protein C0608_08470 [Deltaproteobacteria bacterium]|nr:MAG: hypothetical protein C0608_08470 [Deltaproteobacteria bacterium]